MADNPFADLIPGTAPGVITGPPVVEKPDKPNLPVGYKMGPDGTAIRIAGLPPEKGSSDNPEVKAGEQKAAFLTTNLLGNVNIMKNALKVDPKSATPTWGQIAAGLLGKDVKNQFLPAQRQVIENAQGLIVDAALTLGTGAAYTPEQIEQYRRGFFPQVGDSEAAIKAKRESLRTALMAARINAGSAAPQIDQAMAALGFSNDPLVTDTPGTGADGKDKILDPTMGQRPGEAPPLDVSVEGGRDPTDAEIAAHPELYQDAIAKKKALAEVARQKKFEASSIAGGISPERRLIEQGVSLGLKDEAAGVGGALSAILQGHNPVEGYTTTRDAERLRVEDARKQLGYGGTALEIAGGFLSANPEAALAPLVSRSALVRQGARAGAAGGALAGYGYGEGAEGSIENAAIGAATGGALGGAVSGASSRLAPRGMAPDLAQAAAAEDVRLVRPMVDEASRGKAGALESATGSQNIIRGGMQGVEDDIERGVGRLGANGQPLETEAAGERLQGAARRFIEQSRGVATRLYNRARTLAGDATITPRQSLTQLRQELSQLRETPNTNQGEIDFINALGEDITNGPMSVDAVRNLRTSIRGRINEKGLTATQAEARAMRIMDALQQDATASLPAAAAQAFRRADLYYRERMVHIDDVLDRFLGGNVDRGVARLSGEQAFSRLKSMASPGGDGRRLAALMRRLEPDEQADVAATIAQSLGRRGPDEPFSAQLFISQARKLSPSARRTIFGPGGAQSIENLTTLSRALTDAAGDLNRSRTSGSVVRNMGLALKGFIASAMGLGGAMAGHGSVTAGAAGVGVATGAMAANAGKRIISARMMMSPRIASWLARSADLTTPAQIEAHVRRLSTIAAREPAISGEVSQLQQSLSQALADSGDDNQADQN